MSVDPTREDYWQTTARSTIRERCEAIFNEELLSDVKFVVRDSQGGSIKSKKIPAHKFVLAISSPVFYAMFYGQLAETKDYVEISDCECESLLEMFRFIYSDEVNLNPDNVMEVLYLAKKYMLPSLAVKCTAYLQKNVDASDVFIILPEAQKYEEKDLLDHCWIVIEKETDQAVKSDGFVTIERSLVEELIEKDSLNIKEVDLLKAVDRWAGKECEKQGFAAEGPVKRWILGERIVKGIRFPLMEEKEFTDVVLDCHILTKKEVCDLMKYFNSAMNIPVGFSVHKRVVHVMSRFTSLRNVLYTFQVIPFIACTGLVVDKNIKLHAVRLFGVDNTEYPITLWIYKYVAPFNVATVTGNFSSKQVQSRLGDYQGFDIAFDPPISLKANAKYLVKADITSSMIWFGQNGQSRVEHSGVTFVFSNIPGSFTTVEKGPFAEFLFTLV